LKTLRRRRTTPTTLRRTATMRRTTPTTKQRPTSTTMQRTTPTTMRRTTPTTTVPVGLGPLAKNPRPEDVPSLPLEPGNEPSRRNGRLLNAGKDVPQDREVALRAAVGRGDQRAAAGRADQRALSERDVPRAEEEKDEQRAVAAKDVPGAVVERDVPKAVVGRHNPRATAERSRRKKVRAHQLKADNIRSHVRRLRRRSQVSPVIN